MTDAVTYRRVDTGRSGVTVRWSPDEEEAAREAVEAVVGDVDSWPRRVSDEDAQAIRDEFRELTETDDGGDGE